MTSNDDVKPGDKANIILHSLICYLREKNILSRADIEELNERVASRLHEASIATEYDMATAQAAADEMSHITEFCGKRFGGKRRPRFL